MLYVDNTIKFYSEEEAANPSSWDYQIKGVHVYEENKGKQLVEWDQEKHLFNQMDEMIS